MKAARSMSLKPAHRRIVAALAALCVCGAAVLMLLALNELKERQNSAGVYASLSRMREDAQSATAEPELTQEEIVAQILGQRAQALGEPEEAGTSAAGLRAGEGEEPSEAVRIRPSSMDFSAIRSRCPDAVGWIRIEGTAIDYPIVQGTDNDYYLHHLADRMANASGAIMMEAMNDPLWRDMATTLHGHHMRGGAMFGGGQSRPLSKPGTMPVSEGVFKVSIIDDTRYREKSYLRIQMNGRIIESVQENDQRRMLI